MTDCIFCRIISGDMPAERVYEDDKVVAIEDINPIAPTHLLVLPKKHIEPLADSPQEDESILGRMILAAAKISAERSLNSGYRLVINQGEAAGQIVFHLHLHLIGGRKLDRMG